MITAKTLSDIRSNTNTGVEYEIALFRRLLLAKDEQDAVDDAIQARYDRIAIAQIMRRTDTAVIHFVLKKIGCTLVDVSFETQNDDVGPSDLVMYVKRSNGSIEKLGISVKYANTCTLNATGRKFLSETQISNLREQLPAYTKMFVEEMQHRFGEAKNWFRKRKPSYTTDKYIDLIRDEVISNWNEKTAKEKISILREAYQETSPIDYWVYTYTEFSCNLNPTPYKIAPYDMPFVTLNKYQTSYVGFYLHGRLIGKMQVKFNNGFIEKSKKAHPDFVIDGIEMAYGQPFTSWNFCLVEWGVFYATRVV